MALEDHSDSPISSSQTHQGNGIECNDRLTEVPHDILSFILSFVSFRDAIKSRILSRRWKSICPFMLKNLDFNPHSMLGIDKRRCLSNTISSEDLCKFVRGVDQFVELYKHEKVDSLRVCFCLGNDYACSIDQWIRFAISLKTEKLVLDFFAQCHHHLELKFISKKFYDFPCELLPQGKTSPLKHLCLKSCNLRPTPHFADKFISLKTLYLKHVSVDQSMATSILSGCLNLEWLKLKNSILPEAFHIHVLSLCLKTLILDDCYCLQKIEIYSASLTTFEYTGQSKRLSFLHVPLLEKAHIKFLVGYKNHTRYMFNVLAKDLPQLQMLSVVLTKNELPVPRRITAFSYLKQLELFVLASPDYNLLSLTSLINAAPLLQKFNLSLHNWRSEDTGSEEQYSEHAHLQLKEVEVHGFCGTSNQMELAIYLLNNAVSLDRMTLTTQRRSYRGDRKWTSTSFYWIEWENKKEHAYDLLLKQRVNSRTNLVFL